MVVIEEAEDLSLRRPVPASEEEEACTPLHAETPAETLAPPGLCFLADPSSPSPIHLRRPPRGELLYLLDTLRLAVPP